MRSFWQDCAGRLMEDQRARDGFAALLLAICSGLFLFALTADWPAATHDGGTHGLRIASLIDALQTGVAFPRWLPNMMFGFGAPVLNHYPPAFYYAVALLDLAGLDQITGMRVTLSLCFAVSAWWMYRLSRRFASTWPAVASVACFLFFPYRIYDLFVRGAFPEFCAFVWLPAIAYCTLELTTTNRKGFASSSQPRLLAAAGLAWAGLILTHGITALVAVLSMGVLLTVCIALRTRGRTRLLREVVGSGAPVAIGMLLTAWYIVPALTELRWIMNGHGLLSGAGLGHFLEWGELIEVRALYSYSFPADRPRLPLYIIPTVGAAVSVFAFVRSPRPSLVMGAALAGTLGLGWLLADGSAWSWAGGRALLDAIHFPWRLQVLVALSVAVLLALTLEALQNSGRRRRVVAPFMSILVSAYVIVYATAGLEYSSRSDASAPKPWFESKEAWDAWAHQSYPWGYDLTTPVWSGRSMSAVARDGGSPWELGKDASPVVSAAVTPTRAGPLQQHFRITTEEAFRLLFHQFHYPAWRVTLDGKDTAAQPATELSLASVEVPAGSHNVAIEWRATPAVWVGRAATAVGWLIVFLLLVRPLPGGKLPEAEDGLRAVWRWRAPLAWLGVGALLAAASFGVAERKWEMEAVGADYGNIRLEGVRATPPIHRGQVVPVRLTWLVTGPGLPVSAFVHLSGEGEEVIAGYDVPPGGVHTRHDHWTPGLLLYSTHAVPVPADLAPGTYPLVAGLYRPEAPLDPLTPTNFSTPRLRIGELRVLP